MKLSELLHRIEERIPRDYALDWDNVGLLVGDENQEISKVYVALDATDEVVERAINCGADVIMTHHPLIFSGMKQVIRQDFIGARVMDMIKNDVAYYAMHTNFDVQVMGDLAAQYFDLKSWEVLDITSEDKKGIGCVGTMEATASLEEVAMQCKECFGISSVKVFGDHNTKINCVAISPGSGKSEVEAAIAAGADVLITGDIDHHTGIDAWARNLAIIDAGHYGIEHIYIAYMVELLGEIAPEIQVDTEPKKEPFWVI